MDTKISLDEKSTQWCNGNYELVYTSLRHLRRYSRKSGENVTSIKDSSNLGFFKRFWNSYGPKNVDKEDVTELKQSESDNELYQSDNDLCDPSKDVSIKTSLETLKTAIVECVTKCDFHRPRLVPKRRLASREQLLEYINSKFKDLCENVEKIEEYSKVCNVDQFLCSELLYEGLFFYGVNDSQNMPEFMIIENMLFRQTMFQLRSLLYLFKFVNKGRFKTDDKFDPDKVFPEAVSVLKNLIDRGLVRNLYMLLLSGINETYRFYQAKRTNGKRLSFLEQDRSVSRDSNEDMDYELLFKHKSLYLNTLFDLLTSYYTHFSPTQHELKYIMAFLPHVFDLAQMLKLPEFTDSLSLLFENYTCDDSSAYYPKSLRSVSVWVRPKDFDTVSNTNLTWKLVNLMLVMLNNKIKRFDHNLNLVFLDESFLSIFRLNSDKLLYRGVLDEVKKLNFDGKLTKREYVEKDRLELKRFDEKKLKDLENTREKYIDLELVLDFVLYGFFLQDPEKIHEGFGNNVFGVFLDVYEKNFNDSKFDTSYLPVYTRGLRMLFTLLFYQGDSLTKTWYDLLNYEFTCKRKLELLSREVIEDDVNTAIFREPGTALIHLLKLFPKLYSEKDAEFMHSIYKSAVESYKSVMPNRSSYLYTHDNRRYNTKYYQLKTNNHVDVKGTLGWNEKSTEEDCIKLSGRDLDHLLLFPNRGFSWFERNSALLELVSLACNKRNIFVETYPRLMIVLLEFSLFLAGFPNLAQKLADFLNSNFSMEFQFPQLLQRVVTQLKCLNRGDFEELPNLIYEQIISRDDRIETAEAAMQIFTNMPGEQGVNDSIYSPNLMNTSSYLQEYFKRTNSFNNPAHNTDSKVMVKNEYLKDVSKYCIKDGKVENFNEVPFNLKSEKKGYPSRLYTFPLVNTSNDVRKALSNLGLGTTLPFGLVDVSSLVFKLVVTLDPLVTTRLDKGVDFRLFVKFGKYTYLDVIFSILSNPYVKGTELLVGSLLKSIASVHVTDYRVCKMSMVRLTQLLQDNTSTLGRKLNHYELKNLMYCLTSLLLYLPVNQRYSLHENFDYLLELVKYILAIIHLDVSTKGVAHTLGSPNRGVCSNGLGHNAGMDRDMRELSDNGCEYYNMMDNIFTFLLTISKGPLGHVNSSRATQYLYEQILLPGSSIACLLVKCANEANLTSSVSLICNVFKRDFLILSLHKISKFSLSENKCPNCSSSCTEELVHKNVERNRPGKFTWFLNKIHLINRSREVHDDGSFKVEHVGGRVGCEVCCELDFNQRPLSLLLAHEAFLEALSTYSPDLKCDFVGNLSTTNMELRIKTLYILLQFLNRNCKLYLNNSFLTKLKSFLYKSTFDTRSSEDLAGCRHNVELGDVEYYYVINDADMEAYDLVLYNKLKFLANVDYEEMSSFSNIRELNTCTFKTMVTYFFSLNKDLQKKVVDDRLFLAMVRACKEDWDEKSWYKVYMLSIISKLVTNPHFSKLFLLSWGKMFEQVQKFKFDQSNYNNNLIQYSKLAYQVEIFTSYSKLLNKLHKNRDFNLKDLEGNDSNSEEELIYLLEVNEMDFNNFTHNLITNFCEYESILYANLSSRLGKMDNKQLQSCWNYKSYPIYNNNNLIRLISTNSVGDRDNDENGLEEYGNVVEMYNNYLMAFAFLFRKLVDMYEKLDMVKFDVLFDYFRSSTPNHQLKFMLQLSVLKRVYSNKDLNFVINILIQLLNYLLDTEENHPLLKAKIYNVINYFVQLTSTPDPDNSASNLNNSIPQDYITKLLISHLSQHNSRNTILNLLFSDALKDYRVYQDLHILGHFVSGNSGQTALEERFVHSTDYEQDLEYYRYRSFVSLYFSLEKKDLNCTVEALRLLSSLVRGLATFEANKVEFDSGTLDYGQVGTLSVEDLKQLVSKRLLVNFYQCNNCLLNMPMCQFCMDRLVGTLNLLHSVCTLHQFSSFWFSIKVNENESLSDMFLKSTYLSLFNRKATTSLLLPTMFVLEHILSTTSIKTRNSIITWLNQYCDVLMVHANKEVEVEESKVYICCLLRIYRITFLWLLSDYRAINQFKDNFSLILADLHCKFPLASTVPTLVPKLLNHFSNNLDSNLNWLAVLLCLQTFFPELGAFEMDLNFTSQVPIKTKALELVKLLVDVFLKCSEQLLNYLKYYSTITTHSNKLEYNLGSSLQPNDVTDELRDYGLKSYFDEHLNRLSNKLILKVVTLDCCVILLEYILSLVKLPSSVGVNAGETQVTKYNLGVGMKLDKCDQLKKVIEKLAKVCTANGGSLLTYGQSRENSVEFLPPYQLEHVPSFFHQSNYTHKTLFSTLLTSLLNLDSILLFYT